MSCSAAGCGRYSPAIRCRAQADGRVFRGRLRTSARGSPVTPTRSDLFGSAKAAAIDAPQSLAGVLHQSPW